MENETFWISFISIVTGVIVISIKYCLKSKCDTIECLCLKIHRNTNEERDEPETISRSPSNGRDVLYSV